MSTAGFGCAEVERFCDAYLDGEFSEGDSSDLERHLAACAACGQRVRFQAEWKAALRRTTPRALAPESLRNRIGTVLDREPAAPSGWKRIGLRLAPAAAAAVVLGSLVWTVHPFSPVVADAISKHQRNLPMEVAGNPDAVRAWFSGKVPFAVRPPRLAPQAVLRGARLANVRDRDAAYLVYDVGSERVSVMVFDPANVPLTTQRLRVVGQHDVYLDGERGYHVAVYRDRGIGYAVTSDMDEDRMIQLVSTAVEH